MTEIDPVPAQAYPFLRYEVTGLWAGAHITVLWRTREEPGRLFSYTVPWSGDDATVRMAASPQWKGDIITVGLYFDGTLREPLTIRSVELRPLTALGLWSALWSQWTSFEGWHQSSVNFVEGGGVRQPLVSVVPAAAAWVGLALLIYTPLAWRWRRWDWRLVVVMFFSGWLLLDMRWQLDLWRQLQETYFRYAGKSWEEKRLSAEDGWLFALSMRVKQAMPEVPQRLFLVLENPFDDSRQYLRLHARYHLLPHNVSPGSDLPPTRKAARDGDYVLVLGKVEGLRFDPEDGDLRWPHGRLPVTAVFQSDAGSLFRVMKQPDS